MNSRKANAIFITKDYSDRPLSALPNGCQKPREDLVDREMTRLDLCPARQGNEGVKQASVRGDGSCKEPAITATLVNTCSAASLPAVGEFDSSPFKSSKPT